MLHWCPPHRKKRKIQLQMIIQHWVWQLPPTSWLAHSVSGRVHVWTFMTPLAWFISCDTAWILYWESATKACNNLPNRFSTCVCDAKGLSSVAVVNPKQSYSMSSLCSPVLASSSKRGWRKRPQLHFSVMSLMPRTLRVIRKPPQLFAPVLPIKM